MIPEDLRLMASEMENELRVNILPFWTKYVDRDNGGFFGFVANDGSVDRRSDKGIVAHSRFLWTYAAASRILRDASLLETAKSAYSFIVDALYDKRRKGFFWITDYQGAPRTEKKVIYGQAFALYALAEYARSGGPPRALELAMETFDLLERVARDASRGGYFEAVEPDWSAPIVSSLSEADSPCAKSMNTNLHVMEALSSLYAASGEPRVREALGSLIEVHLRHILASGDHLGLYFDADWRRQDRTLSFGHDIEASWLITEAAGHAWDGGLSERIRERVLAVAAATARALDDNGGSLPNERGDDALDADRIWWVQAEAIVGMVNAWQLSEDPAYLRRARSVWEFVKRRIIDREHGEWLWGAHADGSPMEDRPKGGIWKASYHNGRACMEIMSRAAGGSP